MKNGMKTTVIEDRQQDGRLKPDDINNHISCNWLVQTLQDRGCQTGFKKKQDQTICCSQEANFKNTSGSEIKKWEKIIPC